MSIPELSIIIPLGKVFDNYSMKEREESLLFSLEHFYAKHENVETIIVTQNYDFPDSNYARTLRLSYPVFNKGWCLNVGAKISSSDTLCFAESDMYGWDPYLTSIAGFMKSKNRSWCIGEEYTLFTTEQQRRAIMQGLPVTGDRDRRPPVPEGYEGGFMLFSRSFFDSMGGCNEWLEELGCIDNELTLRAFSASGTYELYPRPSIHLWHPLCSKHTYKITKESRPRNLDLRIATKYYAPLFNKFLSLQQSGDPRRPLCAVETFESAWDRFTGKDFTATDMIQKSWDRYLTENHIPLPVKEAVQ